MSVPHNILPRSDLPGAGLRRHAPCGTGSSDALLLAGIARQGHPLVIVTADSRDAQRLTDEIAWFDDGLRIHLLPDWETLPYDQFSPHQDLVSERLATLWHSLRGECDVLVVPASTALQRLAPPAHLAAHTFFVRKGERLSIDALREQMLLAGYSHVSQVMAPGEYAQRGGLIDLFPMGAPLPFRIELFDDEIDTLRTFDPDSQRTLYPVPEIRLLPAREFPTNDSACTRFRSRFREEFEGDPARCRLYKDIGKGVPSAGIEYYLPLFYDETATLFDYLPENCLLVQQGDLPAAIEAFWQETRSRYRLLSGDPQRPLLPPESLYLRDEDFFQKAGSYGRLLLEGSEQRYASACPDVAIDRRAERPLARLQAALAQGGQRVLLLADSAGRRETLLELFHEHDLKPTACEGFTDFATASDPLAIGVGPLAQGFVLDDANLAVITEAELFASSGPGRRQRRDTQRRVNPDAWVRDLTELKPGDPVVHENHGIGRYLGLMHLDLGEGETEFLKLEYANEATLYVPVSELHVITRYMGADPDTIALHTLGSGQWEKAKRKAAEQARDTAAELLTLYAARAARKGHAFDFRPGDYELFAEGFGFEETTDQAAAIKAVLADMRAAKPMDRLVCGDVGFGKTEVALRAAYLAVADGRQVAVLAPTTLLAEQHAQTFGDRFADWPIKVAELSRFRTGRETTAALKGLRDGSVDIVIGTHKLLQNDVEFARLGLVIIDEEHRFGVRQKEALKRLRAEVDVLTLTATPIPRTLAMSLEGMRDFSVIATAPQKRLAIKTFVTPHSDGIIREAVLRELKRGGQVYFLHNEVDTIESMRERLTKLLPEARIVVGHGQMGERELERVMRDFTHQRANLLLCTTIIETGIDIPTANTILIHRADRFGLAQLHQLRGRVGRSHHQAYAYLLTPGHEAITAGAKKRLEAIQAMEELGSGFFLAMHDLEIRGAGEVLGDSQSGDIQAIGFQLYTDMLNRAVAALKSGKTPDLEQPLGTSTEISLHSPALLPDAYVGDVHERLTLYKRLANCEDADALSAMQEELIDRFGSLPPQAQTLLDTHRLRLLAEPLGVTRIDAGPAKIQLSFHKDPPIEPLKIIDLIQSGSGYRLQGADRLIQTIQTSSPTDRARAVRALLTKLT